jgi:hypothetical protein
VGAVGFGPRYDAEPVTDWSAVDPWPASPTAGVAVTGSSAACATTVIERPLFLALTNPSDVPIDRSVLAWRWDGSFPVSILDQTRIVMPAGDAGISYLARLDREPWPAGRYELQLVSGDRAMALAFCVSATG